MQKFFNARRNSHRTDVKQFDDVLYTPYSYDGPVPGSSTSFTHPTGTPYPGEPVVGDLLGASDLPVSSDGTVVPSSPVIAAPIRREAESSQQQRPTKRRVKKKFDKVDGGQNATPEVFVFEFGTVVCWGMTEVQEKRFLSSMCVMFRLLLHESSNADFPYFRRRFEVERLGTHSNCSSCNVGISHHGLSVQLPKKSSLRTSTFIMLITVGTPPFTDLPLHQRLNIVSILMTGYTTT